MGELKHKCMHAAQTAAMHPCSCSVLSVVTCFRHCCHRICCAESEIGATAGHEGGTSGATLGTLQGGLQPGYAGDASESPRKSGGGMYPHRTQFPLPAML